MEWLKTAASEAGRTRPAGARELCEREAWRNARGVPCVAQATQALPLLAERTGIVLPAPRPRPFRTPGLPGCKVERTYPDRDLPCAWADLGEVPRAPVGDAPDRRRWRERMATHPPQGWTRRPGAVLLYWIVSSAPGPLGRHRLLGRELGH